MSFLTTLAMRKGVLIATGAASVLLTAYVMPLYSMFDLASAAKGGNTDNENRYKVCVKKEATGKDNLPNRCCGITP